MNTKNEMTVNIVALCHILKSRLASRQADPEKVIGKFYGVDIANIKGALMNNFIISKAGYLDTAPKFSEPTNEKAVAKSKHRYFAMTDGLIARPVNRHDCLQVLNDIAKNYKSYLED